MSNSGNFKLAGLQHVKFFKIFNLFATRRSKKYEIWKFSAMQQHILSNFRKGDKIKLFFFFAYNIFGAGAFKLYSHKKKEKKKNTEGDLCVVAAAVVSQSLRTLSPTSPNQVRLLTAPFMKRTRIKINNKAWKKEKKWTIPSRVVLSLRTPPAPQTKLRGSTKFGITTSSECLDVN